MKNIKKLIIVAVVLIGAYAFLSTNTSTRENILVSANIPLTGDLAVYGQYIKQGSEMGYAELKGSYPNVSEIVFDWQDNMGDLTDTVNIFNKQKIEKPDLYISGLKPQTAAITDMITEENIPHFTWILDVVINEKSQNNIRNWVNFKQEAEVFVNYLESKDAKTVYLIYPNIDSAIREYEGIVRPELIKMGLKNENIITEQFNLSRNDFSDIALKVKQANPDFIIINGFIPHLVSMMNDFSTLGINKGDNIIASLDMLDTASLLSSDKIEGVVVAAPKYMVDNDNTELNDWKNRFAEKYNRQPTYHDAYAYDSVKVMLEAADKLDSKATPEEWLEAIRSVEPVGITGEIKFDSDGSSVTEMYPAVYRNGNLIPLK